MADVARRVVRMLEGSLGREDVRIILNAESVRVDAAVATPLAVVLNELVQNAIEHGLAGGPGVVTVTLRGGDGRPTILDVADDGSANLATALPPGPDPEAEAAHPGGLGLRLVRALVDEELGGQFTLAIRLGKGSLATATIPGKV
jgi:two-component sensor histidine kinase